MEHPHNPSSPQACGQTESLGFAHFSSHSGDPVEYQ